MKFIITMLLLFAPICYGSYGSYSYNGSVTTNATQVTLPSGIDGSLSFDNTGETNIYVAVNDPTYYIMIEPTKFYTFEAMGRFVFETMYIKSESGTNTVTVGGY